ncbi:MAG TPA: hypothetical protein VJ044_20170 [Candidatus Hodarchaeales archaeon]|nr:hypothetical protein [Candidatus Hodarchaeales archaeon]HLC85218.1 hypothetical protein [Candidatus Nanoarchaeia archaeon]
MRHKLTSICLTFVLMIPILLSSSCSTQLCGQSVTAGEHIDTGGCKSFPQTCLPSSYKRSAKCDLITSIENFPYDRILEDCTTNLIPSRTHYLFQNVSDCEGFVNAAYLPAYLDLCLRLTSDDQAEVFNRYKIGSCSDLHLPLQVTPISAP